MGSPPPKGLKNLVLKLRSVSSIVMAPAKRGSDNTSRMAVMSTDQTNKGRAPQVVVTLRIFKIVAIKLMAPAIDLTPAK